jgi:iron complex transport system ATP-binding protein
MSAESAAIALEHTSFAYGPGEPAVLSDVSLQIPHGRVAALLGPNGSGKTTLLNLVLGLLVPVAGSVRVEGRRQEGHLQHALSHMVGLVPQDEFVAFDLSVLEYVLLGRAPYLGLLERPKEQDRQIAFAALETVGLVDLAARPVPALSSGERQLATLARALTQQPAILLLDEPTSHLDLANARRILHLLRSLSANGKTILFTTHDPNAAGAVADYVVLLRQGRLLTAGPTLEVLTPEYLTATYGVPIQVVMLHARPLVVTQ